mmetsp:Transcript_129722/g.361325  ORF Transcript_129722/g.361325 Transcript_129722/m.361325 type:complete len:428 (-) Transcript_129722:237-1520(-)
MVMQRHPAPLLLVLPAVAAAQANYGRPWVPKFLHEYPLAICNDGSPAAYYHRKGIEGSRRWLVYLDGVGWCWDRESCAHPWQRQHGTSNTFPQTAADLAPRAERFLYHGLFDPIRSPLADAHIAFVKSCSNDAFMGDRSPISPIREPFALRQPETGWHFRGRRIVEAVFQDLRKHTGLGAQMGDRVVFGGCSAGARGAMVQMDHIAGSEAIVGKAGVVGLLDSGLWVPISPKTNSLDWDSFGHQMRAALDLTNASAFIGDACEQQYPGVERWKCLMAAYRLPFIRTPYFLVHSQYDQFALSMNLWGHWSFQSLGPADMPWAEAYRQLVVRYLPSPGNNSGIVIYSPACYFHCVVTKPAFWTTTADGVNLSVILKEWLGDPDMSRKIWEKCHDWEKCHEFNCGSKVQVRKLEAVEGPISTSSEPALLM